MIYIIKTVDNKYIKIGYCDSKERIKSRVSEIQTGNPTKLKLIYFGNGSYKDEKIIHHYLSPYRLIGEWFDYTSIYAIELVDSIKYFDFHDASLMLGVGMPNGFNHKSEYIKYYNTLNRKHDEDEKIKNAIRKEIIDMVKMEALEY